MFIFIFKMIMFTVIAFTIGLITPEILARRDEKRLRKFKNKIKREDEILHELTACRED